MSTITDFDLWIADNVDDIEDAYCLQQAILNNENWGSYEVKGSPDKMFVTGVGDDTLMLASTKAREAFLSTIEARYADEGLDFESAYNFYRAMSKND